MLLAADLPLLAEELGQRRGVLLGGEIGQVGSGHLLGLHGPFDAGCIHSRQVHRIPTAARAAEGNRRRSTMRSLRLPIPLLGLAALLALPCLAAAAQAPSPPNSPPPQAVPGFVGSDVCATCHTDVADHLKETPHGKGKFASLSAHGCEMCHGPCSAHVNN